MGVGHAANRKSKRPNFHFLFFVVLAFYRLLNFSSSSSSSFFQTVRIYEGWMFLWRRCWTYVRNMVYLTLRLHVFSSVSYWPAELVPPGDPPPADGSSCGCCCCGAGEMGPPLLWLVPPPPPPPKELRPWNLALVSRRLRRFSDSFRVDLPNRKRT